VRRILHIILILAALSLVWQSVAFGNFVATTCITLSGFLCRKGTAKEPSAYSRMLLQQLENSRPPGPPIRSRNFFLFWLHVIT
jgi:hypothetical protein